MRIEVRRANDADMLGLIATFAMTEPQNFECSVQGSALLAPAVTVKDVCSKIAAHTAHACERVAPVWISVRFTRAGVASARVTRTTEGHIEELPEIMVATSDKAMSMQTVEMLADEIVRALAAH